MLVLLATWIGLTAGTGDLWISQDGVMLVNVLVFGGVGFVVMRRQPWNAVGWILMGVSLVLLVNLDTKLYSVLDYRMHQGGLPLGRAALAFSTFGPTTVVLGMLAVLLFPDGRLEGRWRWAVWVYVAIGLLFSAGQFGGEVTLNLGRHIVVDARGKLPASSGNTGWWGASFLLAPFLLGFWIAFIVRQVKSWRRAVGVQREQLKWLMSGATVTLVATLAFVFTAAGAGIVRVVAALAALGIGAFPLAIGVGILRYRLYEIDRLISRTISYLLVTGLLAGVFVGIVLLTTRVLPFSSPVGVAASTLAAAALFNPVRRRVQSLVDHRFNRSHYNAETVIAAFSERLRGAVDPEAVQTGLLAAVTQAIAPAHASIWVRTPTSTPDS